MVANDAVDFCDMLGLDYVVFLPDCKKKEPCDKDAKVKNHTDPSGKVSPGKIIRCSNSGIEKDRWTANCGGYKTADSKVNGPNTRIQAGKYTVGPRGNIGQANGYRGGRNFFYPLNPAQGNNTPQTGLGFHPDGGFPGTHGCVGCDEDGAKLDSLDDFLKNAKRPLKATALADTKCDSKTPYQDAMK